MKILYVISSLGAGGAEKILVEQANYLSRNGYSIVIVVFDRAKSFYEIDPAIKIIVLSYTSSKLWLFKYIQIIFTIIVLLKEVFTKENPDIIISFITRTNIYATIAAKLAKKVIILSEHTNYKRNAHDMLGLMRRIIYPFADAVVVLTDYDKNMYKFLNNIYTINNPLVLTNKHINVSREKVILGVGRLIDLKGFDNLLQAFAQLEAPEWKLIIIGDGPNRQLLEELALKLSIQDKVELIGIVTDVELYYKKASIFVLSSKIEGFPNALCEAMGYGCPSISFDCLTGPGEIITNNVDGILVEPDNVEKLTEVMQKVINDRNLQNYLSTNSKKIINKLDIDRIMQRWLNIIKDVKNHVK